MNSAFKLFFLSYTLSGCVLDSQKGTTVGRSFSLSWRSHPDVTEPMRSRSATTSGAPGVEKARNIVRQKATGKLLTISLRSSCSLKWIYRNKMF